MTHSESDDGLGRWAAASSFGGDPSLGRITV